jgi:hypothetical protein
VTTQRATNGDVVVEGPDGDIRVPAAEIASARHVDQFMVGFDHDGSATIDFLAQRSDERAAVAVTRLHMDAEVFRRIATQLFELSAGR